MTAHRARVAGWSLFATTVPRQRRALGTLVAWSVVAALPALVSGRLVAVAVDRGFVARHAAVGMAWLGVLAVAVAVGSVGARRVPTCLGGVVEPIRDRLVRTVVAGTLHRALSGTAAGTVDAGRPDSAAIARLTGQTETVRDAAAGLLLGLHQVGFTVVAAASGLFWLHPAVALVVVSPVAFALALMAYLVRVLVDRQHALLLTDERVASSVSDLATAVRDVVACGAQQRALADAGADIDQQASAARGVARVVALRTAVGTLGGQLPLVAVLAATPWLLRHGHLSAGGVLGALTYVTANLQPALRSAVQTAGGSAVLLAVTLRRLDETSAPPPKPVAACGAPPARTAAGSHHLRVDRLSFSYAAQSEQVVRDLTFTVRPGEHLAVVGPSGIGKSTLASLLVGLATPGHGEVRIGGVPLTRVDQSWLRRAVALIPQEAYVFAGTLRDNVCYLRPDAGRADLDRVVDAVGLGPLLDRVGGYDAVVGSGGLTSGECQLVALARVWLSPARIVVLDEATCHLHPAAEARAEEAFISRPGTLVVIAHRLSSALRADRVLVMDGAASQLGTHDELLLRSGLYADLVREWRSVPPSGAPDLAAAPAGRDRT